MLCYGPLVSELGGECMVPLNPVMGGAVPPGYHGSAAYEGQAPRWRQG